MMFMLASLTLALAVAALLPEARAHGYMNEPPARQYCPSRKPYNSHGFLRGGGNAVEALTDPNEPNWGGMPGLCGDPFLKRRAKKESNFVGEPCEEDLRTYQAGGDIEIKIHINVNHWGSFKFYLCDRQDDLTQECFDKYPLVNAKTGEEEYWIMEQTRNVRYGNGKRIDEYSLTYKLPEGVSCERCVLQWTWWTKMGCSFPCEKSKCGWNHDLSNPNRENQKFTPMACQTRTPAAGVPPQMYRNCADISITGGSGGGRNSASSSSNDGEASSDGEANSDGEASSGGEASSDGQANSDGEDNSDGQDGSSSGGGGGGGGGRGGRGGGRGGRGSGRNSNSGGGGGGGGGTLERPTANNRLRNENGESDAIQRRSPPADDEEAPPANDQPEAGGEEEAAAGMPIRCHSEFMEEDESMMAEARRSMLSRNLFAKSVKEIDTIYDVSPVGMAMNCMNEKVDDLLQSLNDVRAESGLPGLLCSNKATGVAADFSELMCEHETKIYDKKDNCRLAAFTGDCFQFVSMQHPLQALSAKDYEMINDPAVKVGAAGFRKCGDGHTYWTLMFGGWETDIFGLEELDG